MRLEAFRWNAKRELREVFGRTLRSDIIVPCRTWHPIMLAGLTLRGDRYKFGHKHHKALHLFPSHEGRSFLPTVPENRLSQGSLCSQRDASGAVA